MNNRDRRQDSDALEARMGMWVAAGLTARAEALGHDVKTRLRFAAEQAVARASESRRTQVQGAEALLGRSGSTAVLGSLAPWWQRVASVLPLLLLAAGLLTIDRWTVREQVLAAADIDTQLLADALPPAAYSDPGFAEFLRSPPVP
jgi:hypothetical protein